MARSSSHQWSVQIEDEIIERVVDYGNRLPCSIFRVPRNIRNVSPADYEPQLIHLGLYSPECYSEGTWSRMEKLKREIASAIVQVLKTEGEKRYKEWEGIDEKLLARFIWYELCDRLIPDGSVAGYGEGRFESTPIWKSKPTGYIVDKMRDLRRLYDDAAETPPSDMRLMLIFDAMFLIGFLSSLRAATIKFFSPDEPVNIDNPLLAILLQPGMFCKLSTITADIWLFENQVPMSSLWDVLEALYSAYGENNVATRTVDDALQALIKQALINMFHLLPGAHNTTSVLRERMETIPFVKCKHLLECLYRVINPGVLGQPITECLQSPELAGKAELYRAPVTYNSERSSRAAEGTVVELELLLPKFFASSFGQERLGEYEFTLPVYENIRSPLYSYGVDVELQPTTSASRVSLELVPRSDDYVMKDGISRQEIKLHPRSDYMRTLKGRQPTTQEVAIPVDDIAQSLAFETELEREGRPPSAPTLLSLQPLFQIPLPATVVATPEGSSSAGDVGIDLNHCSAQIGVRKALGLPGRGSNCRRIKNRIGGSTISRDIHSLPTVTNLRRAGIEVKGDRTPGCRVYLKDSLWALSNATLYISQLNVDDNTEKILRNLVAFELVSTLDEQLVSYLACMDDLIDTEEDVRLLKEGDNPVIPYSSLGNDADVARMFNSLLHNCTTYHNRELQEIRRRVNSYYVKQWRRLYVEFVDTYFSKPWLVVSLLAASVLLVFTALQTVYTLLGYY